MSGNLSITAMNLQGWTRYVQSAEQSYKQRLIQAIFDQHSASAPSLTIASLDAELAWRAERLEALRVAHYEAELAYAAEQSDDPDVRAALDAAESEARAELIENRQMFAGSFGEAEAIKAGLSANTPEGGDTLLAYADNFLKALRAEPKRKNRYGATLDMTGNIKGIEATRARVTAAQEAIHREKRELQEAKLNRDRAQEALRRAYVQLATYYESMFRMADLDELADRLRPTARRAASIEAPPTEPINAPQPAADL
jgi:hypothetical protein